MPGRSLVSNMLSNEHELRVCQGTTPDPHLAMFYTPNGWVLDYLRPAINITLLSGK
jgi:hypothetical protein